MAAFTSSHPTANTSGTHMHSVSSFYSSLGIRMHAAFLYVKEWGLFTKIEAKMDGKAIVD